ncbi:MAG: imidazolonepropionase-like amidohydrolase [Parasphingorhabdus sp.]|jgi:imidazolonepropionase-like amidohydrolase|tara:strand:+ start:809 stop:2251 length:1443 start_codon:yes stop_codon:yes gene_type:complete
MLTLHRLNQLCSQEKACGEMTNKKYCTMLLALVRTLRGRCFSRLRLICLLLLIPLAPALQAETLALTAARIIVGNQNHPLLDSAVIVEDDKIIRLLRREKIPAGMRIIDLGDATLMPGMIDAHTHPLLSTGDYQTSHLAQSSAYKSLRAAAFFQKLVYAGWTGLRVAGDGDVFYGNTDIRRAIDEGFIMGPRMAVANHYLSITGGGGDLNYLSPEQSVIADGLIVDGVDEIRKAVRTEIKYGSDWIKIMATGAYLTVGDSPKNVSFSPEEFQAAMDEANRQGIPVMAHAHATAGIKQAVLGGARSIEHGTFLDHEVINLMAARDVWLIPTIYIGDYYAIEGGLREDDRNNYYMEHERPVWINWLKKAHKKGVKIGVGLDFGAQGYAPEIFVREFTTLVEIGMTPMEAIQAGTRVNAEMLGWDDRLGTLEVGKLADIIAIKGNPLDNIDALKDVSFVMLGGRIIRTPGGQKNPPEGLLQLP